MAADLPAGYGVWLVLPFVCECGRSACQETWPCTPDQYDERRADGRFVAERD